MEKAAASRLDHLHMKSTEATPGPVHGTRAVEFQTLGGDTLLTRGWDMEELASKPLSYSHRTNFSRIFSQSKITQAITPIRRLSQPPESTVPRLDFSFFCKMVFTNFILSLWGLNEKTIKCSAQCLKFIRPSINKSCYYKQEILEVKSNNSLLFKDASWCHNLRK